MKLKMKKSMMLLFALVCVLVLGACTAVQVSGELELHSDGSGSRKIVGLIAKQDYQDGYGSAYYYFKQHGDELAASIAGIYADKVEGSGEWLEVAVDDSGDDWEVVTLSFEFSSFEEYLGRLRALAYDGAVVSAASVVAYIMAEGKVDAAGVKGDTNDAG